MATNLTTIKEIYTIVMEGMALLTDYLRERVIAHIEERHPNDEWRDHYRKALTAKNRDGSLKAQKLLEEWDADHIVNIQNLKVFIFENKWHISIPFHDEHKYEETKRSLNGLVEAITKRSVQHRFVHYTPIQIFNDMITIADNMGNANLSNQLNKLCDEVASLEEGQVSTST